MAEGSQIEKWTVYSSSQNLPAILNDPNRGKQKDFFTRTWGDSFVESAAIAGSPRLDEVPNSYFVPYCRKLRKRHRQLDRKLSSAQVDPTNPLFPALLTRESGRDILKPESSPIPRIFFTQNFAINNSETFREVFEVQTEGLPSKMIQDKLSHYLDLVEVGLAQQISKKSSAFFSAVSSQDKVAEKVSQAFHCVRQIKELLAQAKTDYVEAPKKILGMAQKKSNLILVLQKLQLMGTVHQAQRAIQSLLGNSDYVGALDLISTTQEVLKQELQGLVSFRHLDSQLVEIRNAIEKMLRAELERNLSGDLNRPIEQIHAFYDKDRLVSIMLGHLRLGKVAPIVTVLAKEISTAMTATCKQTLIEAVSESDSKSDSLIGSTAVQLAIPQLDSNLWLKMIEQLSQRLVILLRHIRDIILLFQECGDSAIRRSELNGVRASSQPPSDKELDEPEPLVSLELYGNLTTELSAQLEKTTGTADEKFTGILRARRTWTVRSEFIGTLLIVRKFIDELEEFLRSLSRVSDSKAFRYTSAEMKTQTTDFFRDFHKRQIEAVNLALDREKWRTASEEKIQRLWPTTDIKTLISLVEEASIRGTNIVNLPSLSTESDVNANTETSNEIPPNSSTLPLSSQQTKAEEPVRTAEVFFVILYIVAEYSYILNLTESAEVMLGLVELLRGANVRLANLVLGAGAVDLKTIKSVTVSNLAVVVRGLGLLGSTLTEIREMFAKTLPPKNHHLLKHLDTVQGEMLRHSEDLEDKMLFIITQVIDAELNNWEARPPVPSNSVNAVSRNLTKFKEVIAPMLTQKQISDVFMKVDKAFRAKLKERISVLGILKDGGPRHGVVTSEMMHYAENLRKLNVLPPNVISNAGLTQELWSTSITSNGLTK